MAQVGVQAGGCVLSSDFVNHRFANSNMLSEQIVRAAACTVFGRRDVSIDENFFDLGGHSIHAARLLTRLRRHAPLLTVRHVFEAETLRALALKIESLVPATTDERHEEFVF